MAALLGALVPVAAVVEPAQQLLQHVSICAGRVTVQQDARFATVLPFQAQTLPLEYCSSWPIWVTKPQGAVPVSRVPTPALGDELGTTWAPPAAFEQLWLPEDLPLPTARLAIGMVLRNGEPRYIFPTLDTYVDTGTALWRNRGMNSVPIAKSWLHFGESPADNLRLSAYLLPAPTAEADAATAEPAGTINGWQPCFADQQPVQAALDTAFDALDALPAALRKTSLLDGFCFLVVPLPSLAPLPESALTPGGRLRLFLADVDDLEGTTLEGGRVGEMDLTMWQVPAGKDSPYLPPPYEALYKRSLAERVATGELRIEGKL